MRNKGRLNKWASLREEGQRSDEKIGSGVKIGKRFVGSQQGKDKVDRRKVRRTGALG
jgi:hypothetical protein